MRYTALVRLILKQLLDWRFWASIQRCIQIYTIVFPTPSGYPIVAVALRRSSLPSAGRSIASVIQKGHINIQASISTLWYANALLGRRSFALPLCASFFQWEHVTFVLSVATSSSRHFRASLFRTIMILSLRRGDKSLADAPSRTCGEACARTYSAIAAVSRFD